MRHPIYGLIGLALAFGFFLILGWQGLAGAFVAALFVEGSHAVANGRWPD